MVMSAQAINAESDIGSGHILLVEDGSDCKHLDSPVVLIEMEHGVTIMKAWV